MIINGSINMAVSIILQLLSLSIAQCTTDEEKEVWKRFFDLAKERHGRKIFDQLLKIYENRLNTESNDTLKLTVSNMIKSVLHISNTAKDEAIESKTIDLNRRNSWPFRLFQKDLLNLKLIISNVCKQN